MSKFFFRSAAGLAVLCCTIVAGKAMSAHHEALMLVASCQSADLKRAGGLTYLASQDAWISARGQVFQLSRCAMRRGTELARL